MRTPLTPRATRRPRRLTASLTAPAGLTALLLTLLTLLAPTAAHAQDSYRYWGYYQWSGTEWTFAQTGPAETVPADGAVEGWRFAVTSESAPRPPRADGDFDAVCGAFGEGEGSKRVAVVIDPGTAEDSPEGEPPAARGVCAVVPTEATGDQVLTAVATARIEGGLMCAIDGFPATGCGDAVAAAAPTEPDEPVDLVLAGDPTPTPFDGATDNPADATEAPQDEPTDSVTAAAEASDDGGFPVALVAGLAAVAAVGIAAAVVANRNRQRDEDAAA
ncbi:MAG TPA: SCO2322 family protein [Jiangellales bacterium]|nr:SCO2322 family protein [Jiangellales bacterium]